MTDNFAHVSVIIPVYNDPVGINQTLRTIVNQSCGNYDVLVVDNGSTDNTREVIREYADIHERITLLIEDDTQGSYAARNKGIENAQGEVFAFLDADETVGEEWLETAIEAMNDKDVNYLGCNVDLTLEEQTLVGRYNAQTGFPVDEYLEYKNYAPTCALLVRRKVFDDVGKFDSRLISGGDLEFGQRVAAAGYDQGYAEDALVHHPARTSFDALAKKNFRVGRGFCQLQRYYPERYGRPGIPPSPSGSGSTEEDELGSRVTYVLFLVLSLAELASRAFGYYYEFFFGSERDATH